MKPCAMNVGGVVSTGSNVPQVLESPCRNVGLIDSLRAENEQLKARLAQCEGGWVKESQELERLRAALLHLAQHGECRADREYASTYL